MTIHESNTNSKMYACTNIHASVCLSRVLLKFNKDLVDVLQLITVQQQGA